MFHSTCVATKFACLRAPCRFVAHPSAFLIHSPHSKSGARHAFLEGKNLTLAKQLANSSIGANSTSASQVSARHALTTNVSAKPVAVSQQQEAGAAEQNQRYYELISRLIRSFHEEVDMRGTATTVEDEATVRCMRYLPWWSGAGEDMKALRVRQEVLDLQRPLARTAADGVAITWYERRVRARTLRRSRLVRVEAKSMPIA